MIAVDIRKIRTEYKNSLKISAGEEFFDLAVHRPLAYLLVKMIQPLPISPNQVTGFSVLVYLVASFCIATSHPPNVAVAGILILFGNVLDAADGQLARLRGTASQYGRIMDGDGDYISFISLFIAMALWHPPGETSSVLWIFLVGISLLCFGWQASLVDYYRNEFSFRLSGGNNFVGEDLRKTLHDLANAEREEQSTFHKFVLRSYAWYLAMQQRTQKGANAMDRVPSTQYVEANATLIRLWCLNGSATPRFLMVIYCIFNRPDLILAYLLTVGMVWALVMLTVQKLNDRRLRRVFHDP